MTIAPRFAALFTAMAAAMVALVTPASAAQPTPWAIGFQDAATVVMEHIHWFETFTLIIITAIVIFVLALMIYVCWRFSAKRTTLHRPRRRTTRCSKWPGRLCRSSFWS
jgi:heme/copper-type cytochrome/quinol oxidase subunit 2